MFNKPALVSHNGVTYSYLYNLQGDVIGLVGSAGSLVVEYKYNAWGNITGRAGSLAGTLGKLNPFRYRGYVYDEETWMYWLKSRYYDPEMQRFISADVVIGKIGSVNGHNLYAYCGNSPVCYADPSGYVSYKCYSEDEHLKARNNEVGGSSGVKVFGAPAPDGESNEPAQGGKSKYGHYHIKYSDNTQYIGKGSISRCKVSIREHTAAQRTCVEAYWYPDTSERLAFIHEYYVMRDAGFEKANNSLLNKIWSPGRKMAIEDGIAECAYSDE